MKAALERRRSGAYHTLMVGEAPAHLQQLDAYRQQRRDMFNQQFQQVGGHSGAARTERSAWLLAVAAFCEFGCCSPLSQALTGPSLPCPALRCAAADPVG